MGNILALRHVLHEDLGLLEPLLTDRGHAVRYAEAPVTDLRTLDPLSPDLLVVLGGPIGVNDKPEYPFLDDEIALIERRLAADRPTLGLCLGAQLMAAALGASVYPARTKEIGWMPIALTEAGRASCLAPFAESPMMFHWHGDTFDLPDGAERLVLTEICANQAFRRGKALALQFHPEIEAATLELWFVGASLEIAQTDGLSAAALRADTARHAGRMNAAARHCFADWLASVGL